MATLHLFEVPAAVDGATQNVLSPDGRTLACRIDSSPDSGIVACDVLTREVRPLVPDAGGYRAVAPRWTAAGDLLYRLERRDGEPGRVGVAPALGRGPRRDFTGAGIAVSPDGRVLVVADPGSRAIRVAVAQPGNAPFNLELGTVAPIEELDADAPVDLQLTRDSRFALFVRRRAGQGPSLWSVPVDGGDPQEVAFPIVPGARLTFALSRTLLAVLELRPGPTPSSRLYVRPVTAGSLGALLLGPAQDLYFARELLPPQTPAFSPDGKRVALLRRGASSEASLEVWPAGGGRSERVWWGMAPAGSLRFLEASRIAIEGGDRAAVIDLD